DALDGCGVWTLCFLPEGRTLAVGGIDWMATGGSDGAVCLWDVEERCEIATFPGGTTGLAVDPSGRRLAVATLACSLCLWDVHNQKLLAELTGPEDTIHCVAFSPDGRWLAAGGEDRTLRLWPIQDDRVAQDGMVEVTLETQIQSLCFSPDSRFLYLGNGNTTCARVECALLE